MFAEYLKDAIMANHLPTVKFIIQNFHSFNLVKHVYTQCEPLCSPSHSATFPRLYLGGVYSAIAHDAWSVECLHIHLGQQQVWRDYVSGVKLRMRDITVLERAGIEDQHKHTPLTYAAAFGQTDILEYLVQQKADLNFYSSYPVFCRYGEDKCTKVITIASID